MKVKKEVDRCINACDFFKTSMDGMECNHPYFKNKGAYDNMIISQGDDIPFLCPLRMERLVVEYVLKGSK